VTDTPPPDVLVRLAHDLKNPIAVIVGFAELLRVRDDDEIRREGPEMILQAAAELKRVVEAALQPSEASSSPPNEVARAAPTSSSSGTIVIADDDALLRRLVRSTLPHDGFEVYEADDGDAAVALVQKHDPALLVLDLDMPKRSGIEVLRDLRETHPELAVIVITAEPDRDRREEALGLGAWTVIEKPFSPLFLLATIHASLTP
jgi:CheY-like chemotaxis protein